jgi:hypothetical protein
MLTLPIKKRWYDLILSGEKKEEYREVKPYYQARLEKLFICVCPYPKHREPIIFRNGYSRTSPSFTAICSLSKGTGRPEWGAEPGKEYYVLTIHEVKECDKYEKY